MDFVDIVDYETGYWFGGRHKNDINLNVLTVKFNHILTTFEPT